MWDPAFNGSSAQQQQQGSSDLTTHPSTAATSATADHDRHTLHTFGANQPQDILVTRQDPAADLSSVRYNDTHTSSYQQGYTLPSSQGGISEPSYHAMGLPPPPPSSSSTGSITPGLISTLPQKTTVIHTLGPNSHQSQVLGSIGRSYLDKPNNIPMEIGTIGSSPQHSPVLGPEHTYDDTQPIFPEESTSSPPPPSSETAPLLARPQVSTPQQCNPQDQYSPTSSPGPSPARSSSTSPPTNSRESSPFIARLSIPVSHLSLFNEALNSPPDPDLKIRKKTVRFNKNTSPARSEHREVESFGSYSSSSKSPSTSSSSSSHAASSKSTFGSTKASSLQSQIVERDPEERMAELMELKQMKIRQEDLLHLKEQVFQTGQNLEEKQTILDEVRAERKVLHSELNRYIAMVKQVQKDLELATQAETQLTKERDQLSQYLTQLRDHDFKVLKEEVDQLRSKKGLRPLPSLEQEQEEFMGRYLEERRGQWRQDGIIQDSASSSSHQPSSIGAAAAGSSSSSSAAAAGTNSRSSHTPSSSSTTAGSPSTSRSRDRDTTESSRSNKMHQSSSSSSTHSRSHGNNNSSSKTKHESSSRHNSRSSSRRQSSRSRSNSPPTTSSSSRDERSKKRSRY